MSKILTGEEIISALAIRLREEFTTTEISAIYKDTPIEGIIKPCIFLNLINMIQTPLMNNKSNRNYLIDIIVTGTDDNTSLYTWYNIMAERILRVVDKILIDNQVVKMIRGEANIENGELHLITTYNMNVIKHSSVDIIKMRTKKITERVI